MELTLDNIWAILMENAKQIAAITEERKKEAEERKQRLATKAEWRKRESEEREKQSKKTAKQTTVC